jgi:transcription initiation factor IIF auxiliary subunit
MFRTWRKLAIVLGTAVVLCLVAVPSRAWNVDNWAREIEPGWWDWAIYINGTATELNQIKCVQYTLHPTFPNPVRMVCSPPFQLSARGWGTFVVGVTIFFKDGQTILTNYQLDLTKQGPR